MFEPQSFFDLAEFSHTDLFEGTGHAWEGLRNLKSYMDNSDGKSLVHELFSDGVPLSEPLVLYEDKLSSACDCQVEYDNVTRGGLKITRGSQQLQGASLIMAGATLLGSRIQIGRGVLVESGAWIREPVFLGDHSEVRQGAYLRGYCLVGKRCVVGHATEVKHSIFLNDAKAGHFAYVGDSILGGDVNLGAGTKLANLRFLSGEVQVKTPDGMVATGLRKFGAILGDRVQTGCNSVTSPGTLIGSDSFLMPNVTAPSGYHGPRTVIR
jgi:bifunctional N-acetylglucosamine-1-phosphate-uridyltransferase/glucosamine-1-phosphate-acetyltransferase GlmU-like protein